jgi:hypothetical protein
MFLRWNGIRSSAECEKRAMEEPPGRDGVVEGDERWDIQMAPNQVLQTVGEGEAEEEEAEAAELKARYEARKKAWGEFEVQEDPGWAMGADDPGGPSSHDMADSC